jgi:hypothetical protein
MTALTIDHFAISCTRLADGVAYVEDSLGVKLGAIGQHVQMGTHNRLLSLGPEQYLEVIAIDPDAPRPVNPRWFDLDNFSGAPRLTNWICRCDNLAKILSKAPDGAGQIVGFERGAYRWDMAVPNDGKLPFSGAFPALIEWHGAAHPCAALPDQGCRLTRFEVGCSDRMGLMGALGALDPPELPVFSEQDDGFVLTLQTPRGECYLR